MSLLLGKSRIALVERYRVYSLVPSKLHVCVLIEQNNATVAYSVSVT